MHYDGKVGTLPFFSLLDLLDLRINKSTALLTIPLLAYYSLITMASGLFFALVASTLLFLCVGDVVGGPACRGKCPMGQDVSVPLVLEIPCPLIPVS